MSRTIAVLASILVGVGVMQALAPSALATDEPKKIDVCITSNGTVAHPFFETYVKNVLPNEWITSWRAPALKAGAIAVRTYGWWRVKNPRSSSCDINDDTSDQVYRSGSAQTSTNNAVENTQGTRVSYSGVIKAAYRSETGNPTQDGGTPYLKPVSDNHCPRGSGTGPGVCQYGTQYYQNGSSCNTVGSASYSTMLQHYYTNVTLPADAWVFKSQRNACLSGRYYRIETWQKGTTSTTEDRYFFLGYC